MKHKNKLKRLEKRRKSFDEAKLPNGGRGWHRPGSMNK